LREEVLKIIPWDLPKEFFLNKLNKFKEGKRLKKSPPYGGPHKKSG
jgi:hypothetical protein